MTTEQPGLVILFSSGETSASGQPVYDWLFRRLSSPIQMAVLETPAGFQPNSALVAEKVADFVRHHLQNHQPQITVVPARKRGTLFSPDDAEIVSPLLQANVIFAGAGSPTYAVRQLRDTLAWHTLVARHRLGAAVVLASAGVIAASAQALPVYEIYKVGDDPHWCPGLDFFGPYGLKLAFISHFDNKEGGAELDTSRGFIGRARFDQLLTMLPSGTAVVGLDEHTALIIDLVAGTCRVMGRGGVTVCWGEKEKRYQDGGAFAIAELGPFHMPHPRTGIPDQVWERAQAARTKARARAASRPPVEVLTLVDKREVARADGDWAAADSLREQICALGWTVRDTPDGPEVLQAIR
jgi:cyanophycinase-like exopeptidase